MSFPPTPSPYPARSPASRTQPSSHAQRSASSSAQPRTPRYTADECVARILPGYQAMPEEHVKQLFNEFAAIGVSESAFNEFFNNALTKRIETAAALNQPAFHTVGRKPELADTSVYTAAIPGTDLVVRMWEGGMREYDQFCFDFFDTKQRTAVNLPARYSLWPSVTNKPLTFTMSGPLLSWERAYGIHHILPGEERWSFPAGAHVTIKRRSGALLEEVITVAIPSYAHVAHGVIQPRSGGV